MHNPINSINSASNSTFPPCKKHLLDRNIHFASFYINRTTAIKPSISEESLLPKSLEGKKVGF